MKVKEKPVEEEVAPHQGKPKPRQYKKKEDLEQVQRYCALFPWYGELVEDVHFALAARDRKTSATYTPPHVKQIYESDS